MTMEDQTRLGMRLAAPQERASRLCRRPIAQWFGDLLLSGAVFARQSVASFPGKPQIGRDGLPIKIDGKPQYVKVMEWGDRPTADRFSERVVELVRERDPSAFAEDETASATENQ